MVGYIDAVNTMHTRGVSIDEKDYLFTLMVVLGDQPQNAYALTYALDDFKKSLSTEHEEAFLHSLKKDAENMLMQQHIVQLKDLLDETYRAQIQSAALNLENYKFSGQETIQILNNLLKTRVDDLESSSVKDVISLIKLLAEQGALDTGDGGFAKHFIHILPTFKALCVNCNREFDCHAGLGAVCPHCGQTYKWSKEEERFYPEPSHL